MSGKNAEVIIAVENGIGVLTLNRPEGLNALTLDMVHTIKQQLEHWAGDDSVAAVAIQGAGEKAFCAGGDIRALYDSYKSGGTLHRVFFEDEYALDLAIHNYSKPVVSLLNGIVMGGGMGVAQAASVRVVSDRARLAMPETGIGFFPDVGATYFLGRLPGRLGEYLALTGAQMGAGDAIYAGLADVYLSEADFQQMPGLLAELDLSSVETVKAGLGQRRQGALEAPVACLLPVIDEVFSKDTVPEIRDALVALVENESKSESVRSWAEKTLSIMSARSPMGMAVALELVHRGRELSLADSFALEMHLVLQWFDEGDIVEGIRALIVDKDKSPHWQPATLDELDPARVKAFFDGFSV